MTWNKASADRLAAQLRAANYPAHARTLYLFLSASPPPCTRTIGRITIEIRVEADGLEAWLSTKDGMITRMFRICDETTVHKRRTKRERGNGTDMSRHLSVRMDDTLFQQLDGLAPDEPVSATVRRILEAYVKARGL